MATSRQTGQKQDLYVQPMAPDPTSAQHAQTRTRANETLLKGSHQLVEGGEYPKVQSITTSPPPASTFPPASTSSSRSSSRVHAPTVQAVRHREDSSPPSRSASTSSSTRERASSGLSSNVDSNDVRPHQSIAKSGVIPEQKRTVYPIFSDETFCFIYEKETSFKSALSEILKRNMKPPKCAICVNVSHSYRIPESTLRHSITSANNNKEELKNAIKSFSGKIREYGYSGVLVICGEKSVGPTLIALSLMEVNRTLESALRTILCLWHEAYPNNDCMDILKEKEVKLLKRSKASLDALPVKEEDRLALLTKTWNVKKYLEDDKRSAVNSSPQNFRHELYNHTIYLGTLENALSVSYLKERSIVGIIGLEIPWRALSQFEGIKYESVGISNIDSANLITAIAEARSKLGSISSAKKGKAGSILICDTTHRATALCIFVGVMMDIAKHNPGYGLWRLNASLTALFKEYPDIDPLTGFIDQLMYFDMKIWKESNCSLKYILPHDKNEKLAVLGLNDTRTMEEYESS